MKPAAFEYLRAGDLGEALEALASDEEARILAGGQSLVPLMNLRLARPSLLIDVNPLRSLDYVAVENGTLRLGALCRHRRLELDADVASASPLLAESAALIAHPQIRNRGTLGGSVAHGDPAAELPAALVALGARFRVRGSSSDRDVAAADFFHGYFTTSLEPGEMVTEVVVPTDTPGTGSAFREVAPRRGDFAIGGVAVRLRRGPDGACTEARAAGCALAHSTVDLSAALEPLLGASTLMDESLRVVAERVVGLFEPAADVHNSAQDRVELAQLLIVQAVRAAWQRAEEGQS